MSYPRHTLISLMTSGMAIIVSCSYSQTVPEFNMSDTTIAVCTGILYDSGGPNGLYDNNQNITTVINPGGVITLTFFGIFNIEPGLDFLTIYDGPDTSSPLIGVFSGVTPPPVLTAYSGSVTLVFTSDNSAIYAGFSMLWESNNPPPIPPDLSVPQIPACLSNQVSVQFSTSIQCEWLTTAIWTASTGGQGVPVLQAVPQCVAGATQSVALTLGTPFSFNCDYTIQLVIEIPDDCELIYVFTLTTTFIQNNCGIDANLIANPPVICPGQCTQISASVQGCFGFTYEWDNDLPPIAGPHTVCPEIATTYTVIITENQTGQTSTLAITVQPAPTAILTPSQTLCQSEPPLTLLAESAGTWSGPGIIDGTTGIFEPDSAMAGLNIIQFVSGNCTSTLELTIIPISTDNITAACPGSEPFQLNAFPSGGTWDGAFTTPEGMFDPTTEGIYGLTYSTAECTDTLTVYVAFIDGISPLDSICQSVHRDTISFYPPGGYWSGPGIADSLLGIYIPNDMPPGWVSLLYTINGCSELFDVFIKEIQIGPGFTTSCPEQAPLVFYSNPPSPPGGYWTGQGIINTSSGLFDPGLIPNNTNTSIIYHAPNGCSDTTYIYNRKTIIGLDHLYLCSNDPPYPLIRDNINHSPHNGGEWSGPGILNPSNDVWVFHPGIAGTGTHTLYYLKNTCVDSMHVTVYPSSLGIAPQGFCSIDQPVVFGPSLPAGGGWSGPGIVNAVNGTFNPGIASAGTFYIRWDNPAGCADSVQVTVETMLNAGISGLGDTYCFSSTPVNVATAPPGALITGPLQNNQFIPSAAGEGVHLIEVNWSGQYCSSSAQATVSVHPQLTASLSSSIDVICGGAGVFLQTEANGGNPDLPYTYLWSNGAFPVAAVNTIPPASGWIGVTVSDGCSDPAMDSVFITVLPPVQFLVNTSDLLCFGEEGFAAVEILSSGDYATTWSGVETSSIFAPAGSAHLLVITDQQYGCTRDTLVLIPNYPPVTAAFSFNPNSPCISYDDKDNFTIIDLSVNAVSGQWNFGNGNTEEYVPGINPQPPFPGSGQFTITLEVENIGGCVSTASAVLCVLPASPIFIPDIFSPNGDGTNDILFVRSHGVESMRFEIYNRWGERVFESTDVRKGWDGMHRGKLSPSGNYYYLLNASMRDGSAVEMKGEIALIR